MSENLVESLRDRTAQSIRQKEKEAKKAERSERTAQKKAAKAQDTRTKKFVAEHLVNEIDMLTKQAESQAGQGKTKARTEWRIRRGELDPEPAEELAKYRGLREAVASHFTELNFKVVEIDHRDGYEDIRGRSDEGYWPWVSTDHLIGLEVSWADSQSETQQPM